MKPLVILLSVAALAPVAFAQIAGGSGSFGASRTRLEAARTAEMAKRAVPEGVKGPFVEASVLMNANADRFVATFALSAEGTSVENAQKTLEATVGSLARPFRPLGIGPDATHVNLVSQNRIYGYQVEGSTARERLEGFEVKKTYSVQFRDRAQLDGLMRAASLAGVFDLAKVDYIVQDLDAVRKRLFAEAKRIIEEKIKEESELLGTQNRRPSEVVTRTMSTYFPNELYDSYVAEESEQVFNFVSGLTVERLRKPRTFFWNGFNAKDFDAVIGSDLLEPTVQFLFFLRVKA